MIKGGEPISVSISAEGKYYVNETEVMSTQVESSLVTAFKNITEEKNSQRQKKLQLK